MNSIFRLPYSNSIFLPVASKKILVFILMSSIDLNQRRNQGVSKAYPGAILRVLQHPH